MNAPIDYQNPEAGMIKVDLIRIAASANKSLGPLLINFGVLDKPINFQ